MGQCDYIECIMIYCLRIVAYLSCTIWSVRVYKAGFIYINMAREVFNKNLNHVLVLEYRRHVHSPIVQETHTNVCPLFTAPKIPKGANHTLSVCNNIHMLFMPRFYFYKRYYRVRKS